MNLSYSQNGARHKLVASSSLPFPINEPPFCLQVMYKDFEQDDDRDLESSRISSTEENWGFISIFCSTCPPLPPAGLSSCPHPPFLFGK